jgi:peptide/nickel transport system ATP-binding protein
LEEVARVRTTDKKEQHSLIEEALRQVQLPVDKKFLGKYPFQLSGGQQQRFLLAELLVARPELLIADEPTSALDMPLQQEMVRLLSEIREEFGMAILFISHDLAMVEQLSDRIGILSQGRLVEVQEARVLVKHPQHPYTQQLVQLHRSFAL